MDGAKKHLLRESLIRDQQSFLLKLKKKSFAEDSLLRVGVAMVVNGLTTMQLSYSISTSANSLLLVIKMQFTLSMMVSDLVLMYSKLEVIN